MLNIPGIEKTKCKSARLQLLKLMQGTSGVPAIISVQLWNQCCDIPALDDEDWTNSKKQAKDVKEISTAVGDHSSLKAQSEAQRKNRKPKPNELAEDKAEATQITNEDDQLSQAAEAKTEAANVKVLEPEASRPEVCEAEAGSEVQQDGPCAKKTRRRYSAKQAAKVNEIPSEYSCPKPLRAASHEAIEAETLSGTLDDSIL